MNPGGPRRFPLIGAALAVVAFALPAPASAQAGVRVVHTGADTVEVAPGGRVSAAFLVSNDGPRAATLRLEAAAPEGWRLFQPSSQLDLAGGSSSIRLISAFAPSASSPGLYPIRLAVRSGPDTVSVDSVLLRVLEAPALETAVESAPRWVAAGDTVRVIFRVTNSGNVALPVRLALTGADGMEATMDSLVERLQAGASIPVTVDVRIPRDLAHATSRTFRVRAIGGPTVVAEAAARVDLVPSGTGGVSTRSSIPGEVRARLGTDERAGSPLRLSLAGPVAAGSQTRVDLLLSGPGSGASALGEADVYRLALTSPRYTLRLGDDVYRLSPLTEAGRSGTGGEARLRLGALEVGGFAHGDRRADAGERQIGGFADVAAGGASARVNWVRSDGPEAREVWSAEAGLRRSGWGELTGEYGIRPSNGARARALRLELRRGPLVASAIHSAADSAFGGSVAGSRSDAINLSLSPWRALHLRTSADRFAYAYVGPDGPVRSARRSITLGAGYGRWLVVEAAERARSASSAGDTTARTVRSVLARGTFGIGAVSLSPMVEWGVVSKGDRAAGDPFRRARLQADVALAAAPVSGWVEVAFGPTLYEPWLDRRISGGLSGHVAFGRDTRLRWTVQGARELAPEARVSTYAMGRLERTLPFGHRISVQAVAHSWGTEAPGEPLVVLDYTVPFNLPGLAAEETGAGTAVVRVTDAETGAPLPHVLLRMGALSRSTDRNGVARFRGLPGGVHFLVLDRATTGLERVSTTPLPLAVDVQEGEEADVGIALTRAGALDAEVRVRRTTSIVAARGEEGESEAVAGALLSFEREGERIQRVTDDRGVVRLSDLRPGRWTVTVDRAALPPFHRFADESLAIEVQPGGAARVEFVAEPEVRRVRMVAGGSVVEAPEETRVYLVTGLELSLREVSDKVYGTPALWPKIWLANCAELPDPNVIRSGQTLIIPPGDTLTADERGAIGPGGVRPDACRAGATVSDRYRVTGLEFSLREIARAVYGDPSLWPRIWYANRDVIPDPDVVRGGQVLRVPPKAPVTAEERRALEAYRNGQP